ncbi:ABC transporter permease [Flexistipes sinusarabici]|uniref:ABC transporter permease n=1 Tax=Flexistipes sinusarabici TaxID=2352 RepID=UPI0023520234|nr:FtsX-like permease family protein [Flexistipes sinusarabici]
MNILSIPIKNLKVKFFKTILLVIVFSIGITSVVGLQKISKSVSKALEEKMNRFGANILIYPKNEELQISYGGIQLGNLSYEVRYLDEGETDSKIRSIEFDENISAVAPKLLKSAVIDGRKLGIVGVKWDEELKIKNYWNITGDVKRTENGLLLGSSVAKVIDKKTGDTLTIFGEEMEVSGIISETGSDEDNLIFMNLSKLQEMTGSADKINFVEVSALCSGCPIEDIVGQIKGNLPGAEITAVQKMVKQRMSAVNFVNKLAFILSSVIVFTACFMIAIFMYSSVNERKKEIGILRSIGYSKINIFSIFTFESVIVGILSGVLGYAGGYFLSIELLRIMDITENTGIVFNMGEGLLTISLVALLAALSSTFPSLKAARITPVEALISL